MASSKPIPCGPCQQATVNIKADVWCYNCDEGLCSTCSSHHKRSKGTRDHKTIDIKSYKPSVRAIKTESDKHGQQFLLYCPSHLMPCCDVCISLSHSKCTGIKSQAGVVETTKIEKSKGTVERDINSILSFLDQLVNNKSKNIKTVEHQNMSMKKSLRDIRMKINKHLDHLEKTLCQETDTIWNQEKSKAVDFISEVEATKKNLMEMKEHLQTVTTNTSKLQSFLDVHQIEEKVHQCQRYVDDLENDERIKEFDFKIKQNNEIEKILRKLVSIESFGEVMVVKTQTDLNKETSVRMEAQVESQEQSNIHNITMNIVTKIKLNIINFISDMICLMDGRIIVLEEKGKVYLLTPNGKLKKQLKILDKAISVTQINQNTFALTYPDEKAIKIFDMENETFIKVITIHKECRGLSFSNNSLAIGLNSNEICIIDLEGNILKSIQVQSISNLRNLVYCNDRIIHSDYYGKAVYCYDGSGKQIWQYRQDLTDPVGLCTDTYGNTIVADYKSHRIIVISKDGQDSKVLISKEDGLMSPRCISFKHNESSGFICDIDGKYLAKFDLSYG
ncbi:uncharacterized protein LOC127705224 [Mytilus californianus]|uniref:uncharacterized protein LOC127705224 n=1 Tax=Mytilus californianus TaxID=6549 RepID=UPI002246B73F|nr:uncharacterized protein LOC127705224 [Mytilus californianus]